MNHYAKGHLAACYEKEAAEREAPLKRARLCTALTDTSVLPANESRDQDDEAAENWQSIGARGLDAMTGLVMQAIFPLNLPWFELNLPPRLRFARDADPEQMREITDYLTAIELIARTMLEDGLVVPKDNRRVLGFRMVQRSASKCELATGESLTRVASDYRVTMIRRDRYVTLRNDAGDVLHHIIEENIDPLDLRTKTMDPDQIMTKCKLKRGELEDKSVADRMMPMHTRTQWNPDSKRWVIEQELNGEIFFTTEEQISRFISTVYDLTPGENYARGFIENKLGDLRTLDKAAERYSAIMAKAARNLIVNQYSESRIKNDALEKTPDGGIVAGNVTPDGRVAGIAPLDMTNIPETSTLANYIGSLRMELGKSLGLEMDVQPTGDRVTATQVIRVATALNNQTGGVFTSLAEQKQRPTLQRVLAQMRTDMPEVFAPLPKDIELTITTGLAAMTRDADIERLTQTIQLLATLGDPMIQRLNLDKIATDIISRMGYRTHDLLKTAQERQQEQAEEVQAQTQQLAAAETVSVLGQAATAGIERTRT